MILWVLGFVFSLFGAHELLTCCRCGDSPSRIDCGELARRGSPENAFVTLTNFTPKLDASIFYQDEKGDWTTADVPLLADGEDTPRVIVHVEQPHNADNLQRALSNAELTGVVTGRGLFAQPSAALASYNPGMDPGACWIVALNKHPQDKRLMSLVFVGGMALFAASIWMLVEKYRPGKPGESVLAYMSPLLMFFNGLHALGRWLPLSRRTLGAVLLPLAIAVTVYGGYLFVNLAAPQTVAHLGTEFLCIGALQIGVSVLVVAASFLLVEGDTAS